MMQIPKKIIPDSDVKKWTDLGWVFSGPAFTRHHSVVVWLGDDKPREPKNEIHQVDQQADGSFA
jgi:hypothetical protein